MTDDERTLLQSRLAQIQIHLTACLEILGPQATAGAEADGDYGGGGGGSTGGGGGGGPVR